MAKVNPKLVGFTGKQALKFTWQGPFMSTVKCPYCGGTARHAFTVAEVGKGGTLLRNRYANRKDSMWVHDACAVAVYFCKKCLSAVAECSQA